MMRGVFLSTAGPLIQFPLGPIHYGHTGGTYWRAAIWALGVLSGDCQ
jgi:hypothetical protein